MVKFERRYELAVQTQSGDTLNVAPPFTVEFDITRNILSSANHSTIRIYNLSPNNRDRLRKDVTAYDDLRLINFRAGYGDNLPIVFAGNVSQCWSVREKNNFITQIESFDGGFAFTNGVTAAQFPAGTTQDTIVREILKNLPSVSVGAVGEIPGAISRGNSYNGNTIDLLRDLTGGGVFVDNQRVNVLRNNEYIPAEIELINAKSGLLGTPVREQTILHFEMLFEPRLVIGQRLKLESVGDKNFNGYYKVISLKHRGMISESVCGDAVTMVGLFYGTEALREVS